MNLLLPIALFAISLALADETTPMVNIFLSVETTKALSSELKTEKGLENSTKADSAVLAEAKDLNAEPELAVQPVLATDNEMANPAITSLATENIISINEKVTPTVEGIPAVGIVTPPVAKPAVEMTIPAIGPAVSAEQTMVSATESRAEAAEEIPESEMVEEDQEPTDQDDELTNADVESLVAADEEISDAETPISDSEDAHEKAESAMELMELHDIDSEEETTSEAEPVDLLEEEILEEESDLIAELTTRNAQTMAAAAESTIPAAGTITGLETSAVTEAVLPIAKTTLHVEVMANPAAELVTLRPERIPDKETAIVEPTHPIIRVEQSTPVSPEAKPIPIVPENPPTEQELVVTHIAPGTVWTNPIAESPTVEQSVPSTEKTDVTRETIHPLIETTNPATETHNLAMTPTTHAPVNFVTEKFLPTSETTSFVAVVINPAAVQTSLAVEQISALETTVAAVEPAVPITLEAEQIRPSERTAAPFTWPALPYRRETAAIAGPITEHAVPSVEPATSTTQAVAPIAIAEPATTTMEPIHHLELLSASTAKPASSAGEATIPAVGTTIPAAEPVTQTIISVAEPSTPTSSSSTSTAEPTTSTANPTTLATESAPPTAGPTITVAEPSTTHAPEPITSTTEQTTSTTHPTTLATEPAPPTTATAALTAESTIHTEEPRTSAAETAIHTAIESISTEVKPITHHNLEPSILGLETTLRTTVSVPTTHPTIPIGETTATPTHTVALGSDIAIPHLEQTHSTTDKGPSSTPFITVMADTIPSTESTTSAKMTHPTTHMVLLVTELATVPKEMFPLVGTTVHVEAKTTPHAETTIPALNPTTSTVGPTANAAASFIAGFKTLPAKSTKPTRKMIPRPSKTSSLARATSTAPKPGFETAKVFDAVFDKITNLTNNNIRTATESQVKKLTEIWLAFKLYVGELQNKITNTSTLNPEFSLSTPEEVKTWKNLFDNFVEKMRNSPDSHMKKIMAAWNALHKFLLSYKVPSTKKPAVTKLTTTPLDTKGETHTSVYRPVTQIATSGLHEGFISHGITSANKVVISANAESAAHLQKSTVPNQMENLKNDLKHSTKKQLEKYRESWAVFKFYLDSFLLGSKPDAMPPIHVDFTRSTPEEANRNREMFMDFVTELHRTGGFRPDSVLKYWEELKNLLDSYPGIDAEADKVKEMNSISVEAFPKSHAKYPLPAIVAEGKTQISTGPLHEDNETKNTMDTKFARIAYELQRSTSLKLSQFKENWIVFKLYLDSLKSNSTTPAINYHFLFSNEKEQKYMHEIFSGFVRDLRRSPGFPLEKLMQSWHVLNEYLNSYKGADAKNVITSANPASDHKSVPAHPGNAASSTEDQAFQKSLAKEIEKLFPL